MRTTVTALVAAATLAGAALASSSPAQAWHGGWGWGLGGFALGGRRRQRIGSAVLLSIRLLWLLRTVSLSAALRVAPGMERLRLGSRLRLRLAVQAKPRKTVEAFR